MKTNIIFKTKNLLLTLLVGFMLIGLAASSTAEVKAETTNFAGWTPISTAEELQKLSYSTESSRYYLTNDIDLSRYGYWESIPLFKGTLDGNGHCIKNLKSTTYGLFEALYPGATVKNLRLEDVDIQASNNVGGIAAYIYFDKTLFESLIAAGAYYEMGNLKEVLIAPVTIQKCMVSGNISMKTQNDSGFKDVGGILGCIEWWSIWDIDDGYLWCPKVNIDSCINAATIYGYMGSDEPNSYLAATVCRVGGILGVSSGATISNCSNFGDCTAEVYLKNEYSGDDMSGRYQGGIVGEADDETIISNCYSQVNIYSPTKNGAGGSIVGYAETGTVIQSSYYFGGNEGTIKSLFKPTYMSIYDRSNKSMYSGWNFTSVWTVDTGINDGYPIQQWYLPYVEIETPYANMESGYYSQKFDVELFSNLENAKIYYTTDGSDPTANSNLYTGSITINESTTLKIIAVLDNGSASPVATYEYVFACAAPTANHASGKNFSKPAKIKLSTTEKGAKIYYTTNGKTPTTKSKVYKKAFTLYKDTVVKAMVVKNGKENSEVVTWYYNISAKEPKANKPSGTYGSSVKVKLTGATKGATIYYTTNGKTPTSKSKKYTGPITITKNTTLKVMAIYKKVKSDVNTYHYYIKAETPTSNKTEGSYEGGLTIKLSSKTKNATIYYTTDGSTPTIYDKRYTGPITINQTTTIKAVAIKDGMETSDVFSARYYIYR